MNRTSTTPRSAADLRNQAKRLRFSADKLGTELMAPFAKYDKLFNSTPSDAAWEARQSCVADIKAKENCTPVELKTRLASMRAKADRLDSEASELESTALLESIVGRKLGPPKAKPVQYDRSGRKLAA